MLRSSMDGRALTVAARLLTDRFPPIASYCGNATTRSLTLDPNLCVHTAWRSFRRNLRRPHTIAPFGRSSAIICNRVVQDIGSLVACGSQGSIVELARRLDALIIGASIDEHLWRSSDRGLSTILRPLAALDVEEARLSNCADLAAVLAGPPRP